MQPYLKKLRRFAGDVPLVSAEYGSTESWIGVNVDPCLPPEDVTFTVVPTFSYFEFIPLHRHKQDCNLAIDDFIEDKPVPLSQVKVGQQYEIVLTTFTGLYRKGPSDSGRERVSIASKSKAELVDFTSHADLLTQPGHYIIYWEIKGEVEERVLGECCREMDASFVDHGYVVSRRSNSIGPLELRIVEKGTFKKILEHFIRNGSALSQFKTPRCTSNKVILSILNLCTIKRVYSTAYAH
ncbi:jasmonic acid-amido synthetase JAR1 [Prunus yedoensis var. nudiflora]|uniref:Jasmonic acid-amido synthetase JAR1 n=1 Tax=Prunus yedoensis var. nudiflora TaxID=2094558 RepID=A0A314UP25_PRUYE|nr:jasmonic acid-amido synthetase JAR1 [Prunus yedoensis var. nudiflora]